MSAKTHLREAISTGILCFGLLLGLTGFAYGEEFGPRVKFLNREPNKPINNIRTVNPNVNQSQPQGVLCGHITDAKTGQPVTDATVNLQNLFAAKTDASGFYILEKIPEGRFFRISIDSNEYIGITDYQSMPSVVIQRNGQTVRDFKLDRACMIELHVVDEANQPIEGVEFTVRPFENGLMSKLMSGQRRYPQTNKDGVALLGGLPPSKMGYLIIATHGTDSESLLKDGKKISTKQKDYAPGKLIVILNSTEYIESGRIVLLKGVDVTGYAMYEDGVPASDLTITASCSYIYGSIVRGYLHDSSTVDAKGAFTLRQIVPGSYSIYVTIPDENGNSMNVADMQTTLPLPNNAPLTINIPKKSTDSFASIRGNFVFNPGIIPDNINIMVYSKIDGKYISTTLWSNQGKDPCNTSFIIDRLVPGNYELIFSSIFIKQKKVESVDAPSEGLEVEIEPFEKLVLSGTVSDSRTGKPVQSFRARIKQVQSFTGANIFQPAGIWKNVDNKDGKFSLDAIGTGIYQAQIAADGFAWATSEEIDASKNVPLAIKLFRGGSIKGIVVNENGQPVNDAKVMPLSKASQTRVISNDALISDEDIVETVNGSFVLNNLPVGMESIKVVHNDYMFSIVSDIEVRENRTTDGVKVILHKGGTVEGYVYDSTGQPQPDISLIFQNTINYVDPQNEKSAQLAAVTTDASGYYRVEGLPEQICYVQRLREQNGMGVVCRAIVPAIGKTTRLDFGGTPVVKGRVVFDGKPLADYSLNMTTTERMHSSVFQCNTKTGLNGEFTFGGVPKGKWSIYCADPENKSKQLKIATIDSTGQDIDTGIIPKVFSTLGVSIEYEQGTSNWDVTDVYLQYENIFWGQPVAILEKPTGDNEPFIAKNILPGRYRLVVNRGCVTVQQTIDIAEGNANITVRIPKGTAGIRGRFITNYNDWQVLWRDGKETVCYIKPDANGNYELNNLPAGKYHLSPDFVMNSETLLDFELTEGEQKVRDIDAVNLRRNHNGVLYVFALNEYGVPMTTGDIRLKGNQTEIEPVILGAPSFFFMAEPGKYTVHAKFAGYRETIQPVEIKNPDLQTKRPPDTVFVRLER